MAQWDISENSRAKVLEIGTAYATRAQLARTIPSPERLGPLVGSVTLELVWGESLQRDPQLHTLWKYNVPNPAGTPLTRLRRSLARAWRLMLALQTNEAIGAIDHIELQLHNIPLPAAGRIRSATQILRAVGLALQDQSLAALAVALSHLSENGTAGDSYIASTLCRFGFWQLGKLDAYRSVPRQQPRARWSKSRAISVVVDLSIEAAVAFDNLNLSAAKRLASDALAIAENAKTPPGLAALPACLVAQVLYEEGYLDEADVTLRDRLATINAEGSFECVLRAYLVLSRIARQRAQHDLAAILLREVEDLGERRGWPGLVAACIAERVSLLLETGRQKEASGSVDYLDHYAETHPVGSERSCAKIMGYRALSRWRVSWADAPSWEAVGALRQLYNHAVEKRDLYSGVRLAIELAEMLASIRESEEADSLFLQTIKAGAAAGLCQAFLERGAGVAVLLRRAYDWAEQAGSTHRDMLPFVGSLLSRRDAHRAQAHSAQPSRISDALTGREREVLRMISEGFPNKRIARALAISPETVKSHAKRIFLKLAVGTRAEAVSRANSLGLL